MPEMSVSPVSRSDCTLKDGSSMASLESAKPNRSWSDLLLGSMAMDMTGSGKSMDSRIMGLSGSHRLWPVMVFLSPNTAAISPAQSVLISSRLSAYIRTSLPMRSFLVVLQL